MLNEFRIVFIDDVDEFVNSMRSTFSKENPWAYRETEEYDLGSRRMKKNRQQI